MMNGVLLSAGIHAVLVPAQTREEFNDTMRDFYADRDATAAIELLATCGPRMAPTRERLVRINEMLGRPRSGHWS